MKAIQLISQDVFDKIRSRFQNLEMGDETGAVTIDPAEARFFDFDFVQEGINLGRVSISLNDAGSLKIYYSQGITENQDDPAKKLWYSFLKEMRLFAMRRLMRFDTRDIAKTNLDKNDFQYLATKGNKENSMNMNETKKIKKGVSENAGRELTNTPRDRLISRMSPSVDNNALMQKVGKVVNSPEFNSDTILKIVDAGDSITHPVGRYIQKEFDELQYDLGSAYEDYPEEVAEKLLSMLKSRTQQHLGESRWNTKSSKKTSRAVRGSTEVIVRHARPVDEMYPGSRSQKKNIKAIFIQNRDGERFKYPFIHPAGAFAMAQHVDHGGIPHDPAGKAIIRMSEQIAQLQEFQRTVRGATLHDDATGITERASTKLQELKSRIEALGKRQHYESWISEMQGGDDEPPMMELDDVTMETYKNKFTETNFKEEIAKFFPLIHSIMSEANTVDLEDYVSEGNDDDDVCPECGEHHTGVCSDDDGKIKKESFEAFEAWAEAIEQGKLTDDQISELRQALEDLPDGQLNLDTAYNFFNEFGIDSDDLEEKFQQAKDLDPETDPIEVFQLWAKEDYPELLVALGMSGTQTPTQPEAGTEQPAENTDMVPPNTPMEGKQAMIQEIAKCVKSYYNKDNPEVGPFRGEEGIAIEVGKKISEQFGESAGKQAEEIAKQFMEKLRHDWEKRHGKVQDDGLARLKELVGNIKQKVEGIGDRGNGGQDFNKNIMSAEADDNKDEPPFDPDLKKEGPRKDQFGNVIKDKNMAKHLAKQGMKQVMDPKEDILKLAGLAK